MEFTGSCTSSRFSKEEEDASRREIPLMTAASGSSPPFQSAGAGGEGGNDVVVEKEHMFDKVVTPSDVGKLNRLVIPKQYAEKYFPLDSAANEKGLLLNFEDMAGKPWRFRYSYWNSSQSYVMTKGWSRFVKEKRLDAGDTVSFSRGVAQDARHQLFIDWKRRADTHLPLPMAQLTSSHYSPWGFGAGRGFFMPPATLYEHRLRQGYEYRSMNPAMGRQLLLYGSPRMPSHAPLLQLPRAAPPVHYTVQQSVLTAGSTPVVVLDSVPVTTATKRVRLFGVNLDNPHSDNGGGESSSSHGNALAFPVHSWRQTDATQTLLEFRSHVADSSSPSSSSSSKRQAHSSLDLDL